MVAAFGMSGQELEEVWDGLGKGHSMRRVARDVDRPQHQVLQYVNSCGGVRPRAKKRPEHHLSLGEREEVSRGLARGDTYRCIGERIDRHHSTIGREVARNGGRVDYRAQVADRAAEPRRARPKVSKLAADGSLATIVEAKLKLDWSPEQISNRLRLEHPQDPSMWISHEAIYLSIYQPERAALKRELHRHLRTKRKIRSRRRRAGRKGTGRGELPNITSISERPPEVEGRERIGDLEGDLVMGTRPSAIATLVDRCSRMLRIVKLDGIKALPVREALTQDLLSIPASERLSLTWDRGHEMAEHEQLAEDTGTPIYFADAHSPWQRGSNENMNGLIRQYLPKRTSLSGYSQADLDQIADRLNNRPRKVLGWRTPAEVYAGDGYGALTA